MLSPLRVRVIVVAVLASSALMGCASPSLDQPTAGDAASAPGSASDAASPASAAATIAATAAPTIAAATAAPGTVAPPKQASVNLAMTGWKTIDVEGTAGTCKIGRNADGTPGQFVFQALETDYPGLGDGLYIEEGVPGGLVTIKWLVDSTTGFLNMENIAGAVSADHLSISLDHDIAGRPGTEHIEGTITCPAP